MEKRVFPFRAQARADVMLRERLESINREEGREGVRAFKSAAETIRTIESTKRPSPGRIRAWIEHPDESVPLALAERHLCDRVWSGRWDGVFGAAYDAEAATHLASNPQATLFQQPPSYYLSGDR